MKWLMSGAKKSGGSAGSRTTGEVLTMISAGPLPRMAVLKHDSLAMSMNFKFLPQDSPRTGGVPGGACLHRSSWTHFTRMSRTYQTIARIVTTLVGVGLLVIVRKPHPHGGIAAWGGGVEYSI